MPTFVTKRKEQILNQALLKLQNSTPITSTGPGSIARSLAEVVIDEIGDLYEVMDFNTSMALITEANGRALDLLGELYNVKRKTLTEIAAIDQKIGSFYFYLEVPHTSDTTIPAGTAVGTDNETFLGSQYLYHTTNTVTIPAGRTRAFVDIRPAFSDSIFTTGPNTITRHNFTHPDGITVRCTNIKKVTPLEGFESDDNYRTRILNAIRVSNGGTATALRFAGLAVEGIRDVQIREGRFGLGTIEVVVVPEDTLQMDMKMFTSELEKVRPAGIRMLTREPTYLFVDIQGTVMLKSNASVNPEGTARRSEVAAMRYLNSLLPGEALVFNQLTQWMMDSSDMIADIKFENMKVSGREVLRRNYKPELDEMLIPGVIKISPA